MTRCSTSLVIIEIQIKIIISYHSRTTRWLKSKCLTIISVVEDVESSELNCTMGRGGGEINLYK